jgi:hypothetical protein
MLKVFLELHGEPFEMFLSDSELDAVSIAKVFLKDLTHLHPILFRLLTIPIQTNYSLSVTVYVLWSS